ncbi:hypothetical protein BH18ACI1_BH18ACI1_16220 [soil metagenome]
MTKPFEFGELLARLRALLRRQSKILPSKIKIGNLEIDNLAQKVWRGEKEISMTAKEYALLEYFARNAGRVIGREEISEHVWDENFDPFSNLIEVYVNRLRQKIDENSASSLIQTRRGVGYILEIPQSET